MRRVNLRFLLGTIVIVLVLAGGVHAVHTLQYGKHATTWKSLAEAAKADEDTAQQINYLRRYTALEQDDAQAFEDLGNALMSTNRYFEAQLPLATALSAYQSEEKTEDVMRVRRAQLEISLGIGRFKEAETMLNALINTNIKPGTIDPEQAKYREQLARCRMAEGDWKDAASELQKAIELDPTRPDSYALLADLEASRLEQPADAVRRLHAMVAQNPESAVAYRNRAAFRLTHLNDEAVRAAEAAYVEIASPAGATPVPLTTLELMQRAAQDASQALQRAPDDPDILQLAMSCANALSESVQGEQGAEHRKEADALAHRALEISAAQLEGKLDAYRKKHQSPENPAAEGAGTGTEPPASDGAAATVPADIVFRYTRESYGQTTPAYIVLANLALRDGHSDQAQAFLEDGLSKVGRDERLLLQLAKLKIAQAERTGGTLDIGPQLQLLRRRREAEPLARFLEAQVKMARGEWAPALKDLEGVANSLGDWPTTKVEAQLGIAGCQMKLGQYQLAERTYREMLRSDPSNTPAQLGLAMVLDRTSDATASYATYMEVVQQRGLDPADPGFPELFVGVLHAMMAMYSTLPPDAKEWQEPIALIAEAREKAAKLGDGAPQAAREAIDIIEAELSFARKDAETAERMLTATLEQNPQSTAAWIALATISDAAQRWDAAESALQKALAAIGTSDPVKVAQVKLSEAKHHLYRLSAALSGKDSNSSDVTLETVRAEIVAIYGTIPPIGNVPRPELERYSQVKLQYAAICRSLDDFDTALKIYEDIGQSDPGNLQNLTSQLELAWQRHEQTQDLKKVLADIDPILERIQSIEGTDGPVWNFADATRLTMTATAPEYADKESERKKLLETAETRLRTAERSWQRSQRIRRLRSFIYRQQGRLTDAVDLDLELVRDPTAFPNEKFISRLVEDLYSLRRFQEAAEVLSNADSEVTSKLVHLAPTAMLVSGEVSDQGQSRKLRELAVQLSQAQAAESKDFRSKLAHGMMLLRNNDPAGARAQFEAARDMAPDEAEPWIVLIELDVVEGKLDSARQTVERAAQTIREGDRDFALARAYSLVDDREQVRKYLQLALAGIPQNLMEATPLQLEVLLRAAEAYAQQAQQEEVQAQRLADTQPEASAQHHQLAVELDAAGVALLTRLSKEGNIALAKLSSPDRKVDPESTLDPAAQIKQLKTLLPIVHRRLAVALMSKGGPVNRQEALRVLDNNLDSGTLRPEDDRLAAIILAQSPSNADKLKALSKMQKLIRESKTPRDEDRLLAASLHVNEYRRQAAAAQQKPGAPPVTPAELSEEARLHLSDAISLFRDMIVTHQTNPRQTADGSPAPPAPMYVQALVGMVELLMYVGDLSQAEIYVAQLTQAAPDTQAAVVALVSLHFQKGNAAAAIEAARRFAEAGPEEERVSRRFASSQLLESLGSRSKEAEVAQEYYAAAEQLLVDLAASNVRAELVLAGFRARRGRAGEAIAAIEGQATKGNDVQLASASAFAMRMAGNDRALLGRLQSALVTALGANPNSLPLKLMLADLHTWMGEFDAGEHMYREVLEQAPEHAAAANNLAFLLASQRRDLDESLDLINGAIKAQGQLAELLDTRAYVHLSRREAQRALEDLDRALQESNQSTYQYHKALAQLALNKETEAKITWVLATEQGLSAATLHPLERHEYQELAAKMGSQ